MRGLNGWIVKQTSREFVSWDLGCGVGLWGWIWQFRWMGWGWGGSKNGNGLEGWIRKWSQHCQSFTSPLHHLLGPQWQRLLRPGSTHLPLPSFSCIYVLKILITSKLRTYLPLWHWAETAKKTKQKKKHNDNGRDRRTMEDCGYGPGLGQITVSLTTIIPALTPAPPSTPCPSAPQLPLC